MFGYVWICFVQTETESLYFKAKTTENRVGETCRPLVERGGMDRSATWCTFGSALSFSVVLPISRRHLIYIVYMVRVLLNIVLHIFAVITFFFKTY